MPKLNFDKIDDMESYSPVPAGQYLCRVKEIIDENDSGDKIETKSGDEMWKLRFSIVEGEFKGRNLWDNLVFSANALKRVKFICSRMGIPVSGNVDLTPKMLTGKVCLVTVNVEDYINDQDQTKTRNVIPYDGYERADESAVESAKNSTSSGDDSQDESGEDELPF